MQFENKERSPLVEAINARNSKWDYTEIKVTPRFISLAINKGYSYCGMKIFDEEKETIITVWNDADSGSNWTPLLEVGNDEHIIGFSLTPTE